MKVNKSKLHSVQEEHENDELWAISYGDMITLLLSFFVIFFSTDFKKNQQEKVDDHFISNFKMLDLKDHKAYTAQAEKSIPNKVLADAPKFDLLKNAKITKLSDRLLITFDKMNFYKTAETEPTSEGTETLKAFAQKFLPYSSIYKIDVKAFTDKRPVKGSHRYKDNLELSALRAISALRVLQNAGIPLNKLEIAGYGEMDKLNAFLSPEKIKELNGEQIQDISRTLIIIIKHDNEQSVL